MSDNTVHLAERAAQRLKDSAPPGLAALLPAAAPPPPRIAPAPLPFPAPPAAPHSAARLDRRTLESAGLVGSLEGRSRTAQEFSILQSELLGQIAAAGQDGESTVVMITSARPGEGKTFVSLNLAASLAHNNKRDILLVDTDAKGGNLSSLLGIADRPGLLNLLHRPGAVEDTGVVGTDVARLRVLPVGQAEPGDDALHEVASAAAITDALRRHFPRCIIVLDAAAGLNSSDPATLAPLIDQTVVVVAADQTKGAELSGMIELLRGSPNISLVLNRSLDRSAATFGGHQP